jgi:hypothetical protein
MLQDRTALKPHQQLNNSAGDGGPYGRSNGGNAPAVRNLSVCHNYSAGIQAFDYALSLLSPRCSPGPLRPITSPAPLA